MAKSVLHPPAKGFKVVEVAWGPPTKYLAAHIPSALYLNTNMIESEPWWNRVDDQQTGSKPSKAWVSPTIPLSSSMAATTPPQPVLLSLMMYAGVDDVRLLNGGWQSWVNAGLSTQPLAQPRQARRVWPHDSGKSAVHH